MYITIAYETTDPDDDPDDFGLIDAAVDQAVADAGFVNAWRPLRRTVLANIPVGGSRSLLGPLQQALGALPATFIVTASDTAWAMARSPDVPKASTDATSDFPR